MIKTNNNLENNFFWEIPEIDLHLRHYSGHPSDVIKQIKLNIENYLSNPNLIENRTSILYDKENNPYMISYNIKEVYSAVYNALNYYKNISYLPSAEFETGDSFLSNSIKTFNEDFDYLSEKYNSKDPMQEPVISVSARIKSPLSFMNKLREKITEYIQENWDFKRFNESLRDLIGVRFVVNPPDEVKKQGPEAETNYLYSVYYDLMTRHGITNTYNSTSGGKGLYKFYPVNNGHDKSKLEKIKSRPTIEGFAPYVKGHPNFYRPFKRIPEMEQECVDLVTKDYVKWPKFKGYQSLHTCVIPDYSKNVDHINIPNCIIPPTCKDSFVEYQFRTARQNEYAEHGPVSHNSEYKPTGAYHRLAVPFYIEFDSVEDLPEIYYVPDGLHPVPSNYKNKLKLRNFAESFRKFYGPSFEEYFGIPFKKFRDIFGSQDRNDILAKRKLVIHDEELDLYRTKDVSNSKENNISLALSDEEISTLKNILANKNPAALSEFFSNQHLQDAILQVIQATNNPEDLTTTSSKPAGINLYSLEDSNSRVSSCKENIEQDLIPQYSTSTNSKNANAVDSKGLDDD